MPRQRSGRGQSVVLSPTTDGRLRLPFIYIYTYIHICVYTYRPEIHLNSFLFWRVPGPFEAHPGCSTKFILGWAFESSYESSSRSLPPDNKTPLVVLNLPVISILCFALEMGLRATEQPKHGRSRKHTIVWVTCTCIYVYIHTPHTHTYVYIYLHVYMYVDMYCGH